MDIGSLTGQIAIEDQFSGTFALVIRSVEDFSKQFTSSLGLIGVGAGIATAGVVALTGAVTSLAIKGSDVNDVSGTFEKFANRVSGAEETLTALRNGVQGTVDDLTLMGSASRLLSANVRLNATDFGTLSEAAFVLQNRGLGSTTQMLNMVTSAMITGRTRTLAMTLGVVDAGDQTIEYARKLGVARSQLTQTQLAEARRLTVLGMLRSAVADAGKQELDLGERIERIGARVSNWWDTLASKVAASPTIARAFDMVESSIAKLSSSTMLERVVGWLERFADAAVQYGPPIVDALVKVKNWISNVWNAVVQAWESVPDWFKNIARDAALAGAGMYLVTRAVDSMIAKLPVAQQSTESFMTTMNDYATVTDAAISVSRVFADIGLNKIKDGFGFVITKGSELRTSINNIGEAMKFANGLGGSLFSQFATGAVVTASLTAAVMAGYQAWKLWQEARERAAAAKRQESVDATNLATLNNVLGTSYKTVREASEAWIARQKDAKPAVAQLTEEQRIAIEVARAHKEKVDALVGTLTAAAAEVNLTSEAFEQLTANQLVSRGVQASMIPLLDKKIEQGYKLTSEEREYYKLVSLSRINIEKQSAEILKANGITLERIEVLKALGYTEAEIAAQTEGVTIPGLQRFMNEMTNLRGLEQEVQTLRLQASGHTAEAYEQDRQREYEAALRSFDGTSVEMEKFAALMQEKFDLIKFAGTQAWQAVQSLSISARQQQLKDAEMVLLRMQTSGNFFRADIDRQRQHVDQLRDSFREMGDVGTAAYGSVSSATQQLIPSLAQAATSVVSSNGQITHTFSDLHIAMLAANSGIDATNIKVKMLDGSIISLADALKRFNVETSMTYDLSTEAGMAHFRKLNPSAYVGVGTEYFKEHTLEDAVRAGLVDLYAGYKGITGGAMSLIQSGWMSSSNPMMGLTGRAPMARAEVAGRGGVAPLDIPVASNVLGLPDTNAPVVDGPMGINRTGTITNIFHVNGTAEETAAKIGKILMDKVWMNRRLQSNS